MNLPNKLTTLRLILVIPFIGLLLEPLLNKGGVPEYHNLGQADLICFLLAGLLFAFAMFTDYLDGHIARKTNTVTTFGKLFDPLADKFFTTTALIFLSVYRVVPIWVVIIMVLRDILVDGSRSLAAKNNVVIAASIWGKSKTMVQSIAIIILIFVVPSLGLDRSFKNTAFQYNWKLIILNIPLFFALLLSLYSGVLYVKQIRAFINIK